MTPNAKIGIALTLIVGTIVAIATKDKWIPIFKKQPILPVNPIEETKSEFRGARTGGSGRHGGRGRYPYPYYPYPMGVPMYPAEFYVNPDQLCEFKTASGKKLIANCDQSKALTLQNR